MLVPPNSPPFSIFLATVIPSTALTRCLQLSYVACSSPIVDSGGWGPLIIDMAAVSCHAQPEHPAVWECSCAQPALPFCTSCLPLHVQSAGLHHISPLGPMGPHSCGLCKGQSSDPVTAQYPICICQTCVQNLSGGAALPPAIFGRPADIDHLREAADVLPPAIFGRPVDPLAEEAEKAADERVEPAGNLRAVFRQRKNDLNLILRRAMENVNVLEVTLDEALDQEAELRLCQVQLAAAQAEVQRLQALP